MADPKEPEPLRDEIARRAYTKFCDRGCAHGNDMDDWLAAEREVLAESLKPAGVPKRAPTDAPRRRKARGRQ